MEVTVDRVFMFDSKLQLPVPIGTYTVMKDRGGGMRMSTVILSDGKTKYTVDDYDYRGGLASGWINEVVEGEDDSKSYLFGIGDR